MGDGYHRAGNEDPPAQDNASSLPVALARLEERLVAGDRLYQHKFTVLENQIEDLDQKVQVQQKWIQGTAVLVGLEVLGLIVGLLSGWRPA